jgi:hypothetical protein
MIARVSVPFTEGHYYGGEKRSNAGMADNIVSLPEGKTYKEFFIKKEKKYYFRDVYIYLTTVTGQYEYVTMSDATLPSNIFLNPEFPLLPITIRSTSLSSA